MRQWDIEVRPRSPNPPYRSATIQSTKATGKAALPGSSAANTKYRSVMPLARLKRHFIGLQAGFVRYRHLERTEHLSVQAAGPQVQPPTRGQLGHGSDLCSERPDTGKIDIPENEIPPVIPYQDISCGVFPERLFRHRKRHDLFALVDSLPPATSHAAGLRHSDR